MDLRDYISSGILELYACNALPDQERKDVEAMLAKHPELAAELGKIEAAMEGMAGSMAKDPPARARAAFLDAISEDSPASSAAATQAGAPDTARSYQKRLNVYKWSLAASVALLLLSSFLAAMFYSRWKNSSNRVIALQEQQSRLAQENKVLSGNYNSALAMLRNPSTKIIALTGTESHPESKAMVYWDEATGDVVLDQLSLPGHDQEHQYQLWAIQGGKPVDAGVFDTSEEPSLVSLKTIREAEAFAITLEPRGGSEAPTLDQMVVIGKI